MQQSASANSRHPTVAERHPPFSSAPRRNWMSRNDPVWPPYARRRKRKNCIMLLWQLPSCAKYGSSTLTGHQNVIHWLTFTVPGLLNFADFTTNFMPMVMPGLMYLGLSNSLGANFYYQHTLQTDLIRKII